jgi:hypothetical protein
MELTPEEKKRFKQWIAENVHETIVPEDYLPEQDEELSKHDEQIYRKDLRTGWETVT